MRIGELAKRTGCLVQTIRYYESEGLLPPPERTENNYRLYTEGHLSRLSFILRCRSLDMAQDEIRALLVLQDDPARPCDDVNSLLDAHIAHVNARIDALEALRGQLQSIRRSCSGGACIGECGALGVLRTTTNTEHAESHIAGTHL
ncbi:Cd(II)/Pb(II)-responsive transcriptional regulator [Cupriavidus sp. USMAA2-4]|uniref:Cd(II)/Pb(II)-responsive transcriptional regulator n=1 Tax=Cupriavidus sp. USMAA2-4 TaxID=876364 RepID=UPI0008A667CC|nr:Cd(II)/Pb(II)-responsive transcriptional regulator [Cupriavidus sp. USMAA2-4]AOY96122.1 Cd(II)/Pb(II)-responsive transcriptional regulator [Cupriavidus sp. USMAA2-4]